MTFKYYKRDKGELDTSNFPEILKAKTIIVDTLDEKTFMSLLALNEYCMDVAHITVIVTGYIAHLRGDKDVFSVASLYDTLDCLTIVPTGIQHESTHKVQSAKIAASDILRRLELSAASYVGADKSVHKFFPGVTIEANKVRTDGKVISTTLDVTGLPMEGNVIIVDDILGGGATIQAVYDIIRGARPLSDIYLWVAYNEGIHNSEFLDQFADTFIGDLI